MDEFNTLDLIGSIYAHSFRLRSSTPKKKKLVEFVCFCLNPNHYHFLLKQVADKGIEKFMHRLSTGYTNYFNLKHKRNGALFQGRYKAIHINTNEQLLHVSAYVNLNFQVHKLLRSSTHKLNLSSLNEYVGESKVNFCQKDDILGQFKNKKEYENFIERALKGILERKEMLRELEE